jgi:hypothetical protein
MAEDAAVTAYIERARPFAQPILRHIRALVHQTLPGAGEAMKWGMPFFTWQGAPLANMAAFKAHAAFGFWRREGAGPEAEAADGMGQYGKLATLADLPPDAELTERLRAAARVIESGAKTLRPPKQPRADIPMPDDLAAALATTPAAQTVWEGFPPGARREYLEWITQAKQPATRTRRMAQAIEWIAQGRKRNWKYEAC